MTTLLFFFLRCCEEERYQGGAYGLNIRREAGEAKRIASKQPGAVAQDGHFDRIVKVVKHVQNIAVEQRRVGRMLKNSAR